MNQPKKKKYKSKEINKEPKEPSCKCRHSLHFLFLRISYLFLHTFFLFLLGLVLPVQKKKQIKKKFGLIESEEHS